MSGGLSEYVVKNKSDLCETALGVFIGFDVRRIIELCIVVLCWWGSHYLFLYIRG